MTSLRLLRQSLRHYWRTHLGIVLGAALGALVLTGSLLTGDSVKATLRQQAEERIGQVQQVVLAGDRFFRAALAHETGPENAPVLFVRASVARADGQARVNQAQVLGVTPQFWSFGPASFTPPAWQGPQAILNERLASQLGVTVGQTLIIRLEKPSHFSKDAPLSGSESETVALRVPVTGIISPSQFGNFALQASQVPPFSLFLPLEFLGERLGLPEGANLLLEKNASSTTLPWQLADAGLELRPLPKGDGLELRSNRVFLDPPVEQAAPAGVQALTYLVNEIRAGDHAIPYSMATATDTTAAGLLPNALGSGEAAISQWVADDLGIGVGARLSLKYYLMGERRQLEERTAEFTVRAVIPMETPALNSSWMPDFPGLSDKKNCRDWEPGFAIDNTRIRDQDEKYWDTYKGTPKVFIGLAEGQRLWANRWGRLTSIHYPAGAKAADLAATLRAHLAPEQIGLNTLPVRSQALAATKAPVDFGELFAYFSFFLLGAAAILTGLLFVFALEQRNEEAGLLLALGWRPGQVRRQLLAEGAVLAVLGSALGVMAASAYARLALQALATVWQGAVGGTRFIFAASPATLAIGFLSGLLLALSAMWLASRRQLRHSARALLASAGSFELEAGTRTPRRSWSLAVALGCGATALLLLLLAGSASPEAFFGAGALLLIAGLALGLTWLRRTAGRESRALTWTGLGERNAARRRGRSLATIAVLASGVFMVVAVDSFRQRPDEAAAAQRKSGTGGFALLGETSLPLYEDLNTAAGRETYALPEKEMAGVAVVPFRVRAGDDASCLNLNRAVQPRILGVKPPDLTARGAFTLQGGTWDALAAPGEEVPGIVDANTLQWALQKKLGDTLTFLDERGASFQIKLVASVAGSVLQGSVIIAESRFVEKYPSQGGYRFFLIDAPSERRNEVAQALSRALIDRGLEVTPTARRLAEFQAVENTYLSIFQALGGLGLLLGSVGLAIVVARNVLERRREFGLLAAVGFQAPQLRRLVFAEHRWLILCGLAIGVLSALVAVWPSLHDRTSGFPYLEMLGLLAALTAGSLFWTWLATRLALRGEQLSALRAE